MGPCCNTHNCIPLFRVVSVGLGSNLIHDHVVAKQVVLEILQAHRITNLKRDVYHLDSSIAPQIMMNGWTTYVLADSGSDLADIGFACLEN